MLKVIEFNKISRDFSKNLDFKVILDSWKIRINDLYKNSRITHMILEAPPRLAGPGQLGKMNKN